MTARVPKAGSAAPRVLLVDDSGIVRRHVSRLLRHLGCEVQACEFGTEALAWLEENPAVDLLITDLAMPGKLDGRGLIAAIHRRHPELPVVVSSGMLQGPDGAPLPGLENCYLLPKPYGQKDLATLLDRVLGQR